MLIESINGADISDLEFKKASFSVKFAARPANIVFRANSGGVMNQTAYNYNPAGALHVFVRCIACICALCTPV